MIFEYNVELIIMVCQLTEKNMSKCERYWPIEGESIVLEDFKIKSIKDYDTKFYGLRERQFEISNKQGLIRNITQLNFTKWPDHGVPEVDLVFESFLEMLDRVKDHLNEAKESSPVVVHCSAGVGRTGTFMSLFTVIKSINLQILDKTKENANINFNIWNTVRQLKEQRLLSVENFYQYQFIYRFIGKLLKMYFK